MSTESERETEVDPCSYEIIDFSDLNATNDDSSCLSNLHSQPLTCEEFKQFFQDDGRIVDEHALRKLVFRGGVEPTVRRDVWQFLFGLYPFTSTAREREVLKADYHVKYNALKERWKALLGDTSNQAEGATKGAILSSDDRNLQLSPEAEQQVQFLKIQAQIHAARRNVDLDELKKAIRIIDKDVHRTDRDLQYFKGDDNPNLVILRNILVTFAAFHPEVSYAQGMNDVLSRFLIVFNSEVEAYWCFSSYIEHIQLEFMEEGMVKKIELVQKLLVELDRDLYDYLSLIDVEDLTFCHRWLILSFKREFNTEDSYRCFEILSSHHLELNSMEAEKARIGERRKEFEQKAGEHRTTDTEVQLEFTFDIFLCVAILIEYRMSLFKCSDATAVFQFIMSLSMQLNLDYILKKAEALFFKYCRKSAVDCFEVVETPERRRRKNKIL